MTVPKTNDNASASGPARVGVDLVDLERFKAVVARTPSFVSRVFSEEERAYCEYKPRPIEHYAARFAAREAVLKALGIGWAPGVRFQDVSVGVDEFGSPYVILCGEAARQKELLGIETIALSISHTSTLAVANAVVLLRHSRTKEEPSLSEAARQKEELARVFKDAKRIVLDLEASVAEEAEKLARVTEESY